MLADAARELDPTGARVAIVAGDIGREAVGERIAAAARRLGGMDVLVNAAGIFAPAPFAATTTEQLDAYHSTIVKSTSSPRARRQIDRQRPIDVGAAGGRRDDRAAPRGQRLRLTANRCCEGRDRRER